MMKKVYINNIKIIIEDIINVKENEDEIIPLIPSYYAEKYRRIAGRQNVIRRHIRSFWRDTCCIDI